MHQDESRTPGFEQSLARLEQIVAELEGGDVPLDDALKLFEEGMKLGRACTSRLDEAEKRITLLLQQADGSVAEIPFDPKAAAPAPTKAPATARRAAAPPRARPQPIETSSDDEIPF